MRMAFLMMEAEGCHIRFNLTDPAHEKSVRILEQQGSRCKAQYLVNAILAYSGEQPTLQGGGNPDRRQIEQIVREVLAGQKPPPERQRSQPALASTHGTEETKEATYDLIADTPAVFCGQGN